MSFRQTYYHIVFGTKARKKVLDELHKESLFKYIWGIINNKKCFLHQINAHKNHIHLLVDIHPTLSLSDFVKMIKTASSIWLKENTNFKNFESWGEGYGAFTVSHSEKDKVINYIKNQQNHHRNSDFKEEFILLLQEHDIKFEEKYLI